MRSLNFFWRDNTGANFFMTGPLMKNVVVRNAEARTVTRADLSEAVYQKIGLSRAESAGLVEMFLEEVSGMLESGESVKLSSFGSFLVRAKGNRIGRNPKTGLEVPILPRQVMVFKASNVLRARVNGLEGGVEAD